MPTPLNKPSNIGEDPPHLSEFWHWFIFLCILMSLIVLQGALKQITQYPSGLHDKARLAASVRDVQQSNVNDIILLDHQWNKIAGSLMPPKEMLLKAKNLPLEHLPARKGGLLFKTHNAYSAVSYQTQLKGLAPHTEFALIVPKIPSQYHLFLNDTLVSVGGRMDENVSNHQDLEDHVIVRFPPETSEVILTLHITDPVSKQPNLIGHFALGPIGIIEEKKRQSDVAAGTISALCIGLGFLIFLTSIWRVRLIQHGLPALLILSIGISVDIDNRLFLLNSILAVDANQTTDLPHSMFHLASLMFTCIWTMISIPRATVLYFGYAALMVMASAFLVMNVTTPVFLIGFLTLFQSIFALLLFSLCAIFILNFREAQNTFGLGFILASMVLDQLSDHASQSLLYLIAHLFALLSAAWLTAKVYLDTQTSPIYLHRFNIKYHPFYWIARFSMGVLHSPLSIPRFLLRYMRKDPITHTIMLSPNYIFPHFNHQGVYSKGALIRIRLTNLDEIRKRKDDDTVCKCLRELAWQIRDLKQSGHQLFCLGHGDFLIYAENFPRDIMDIYLVRLQNAVLQNAPDDDDAHPLYLTLASSRLHWDTPLDDAQALETHLTAFMNYPMKPINASDS